MCWPDSKQVANDIRQYDVSFKAKFELRAAFGAIYWHTMRSMVAGLRRTSPRTSTVGGAKRKRCSYPRTHFLQVKRISFFLKGTVSRPRRILSAMLENEPRKGLA